MLSNNRKRKIKRESDNQTRVNYKNVKKAVEKSLIPDLNNQTFFKNEDGTYPPLLYAALDNRCYKSIMFLLERGVDPNIVAPGRESFFLEVLKNDMFGNSVKLIEKLVNAGADINKRSTNHDNELYVPLVLAIYNGQIDVAKFLIESGADLEPSCVNSKDCMGCNPLQAAVEFEGTYRLANLLLDKGVDVNKFCKFVSSPLDVAAVNNETKLINRLLNHGIDVTWMTHGDDPLSSETVLHYMVECKNLKSLQLMLEYELTDVNTVHPNAGWSVLHHAVHHNSLNCMDILLNANPDVNLVGRNKDEYKLPVEVEEYSLSNKKAREKLKKHMVKLRAAGFYLSGRNLAAISEKQYQNFYLKCLQEVDLMKKTPIATGRYVHFHSLLSMTNKKLGLCLESLDYEAILESGFHEKFPSYAGMIEYKLNKGNQWVKLREELHSSCKILNNHIPSTIKEQIFSYFSMKELMELRRRRWKEEGKWF